MISWTFGGIPFIWLRQEANGHPARATWDADERLVVRPLLGGNSADVAALGFEAMTISGPIYVEAASVDALRARKGQRATLSDGSSSWQAVMRLRLLELDADGGASGEATFIRPRP